MRLNSLKIGLLSILFLTEFSLFGQVSNGIQLCITPYSQDIGNLKDRYTNVDCETVHHDYKKYPAFGANAFYVHHFNRKWGWGVGLGYRRVKSRAEFQFNHYEFDNYAHARFDQTRTDDFLGLKFMVSYNFSDRIGVNAILHLDASWRNKVEGDEFLSQSSYVTQHEWNGTEWTSTPVQENHMEIRTRVPYYSVCPEIRFNYRVWRNLNAFLGFRFNPFDSAHKTISVQMEGFNGPENNTTNELLFESNYDVREYSLNIGFAYDFIREKKKAK